MLENANALKTLSCIRVVETAWNGSTVHAISHLLSNEADIYCVPMPVALRALLCAPSIPSDTVNPKYDEELNQKSPSLYRAFDAAKLSRNHGSID